MSVRYYAGIGSRETPQPICAFFKDLAYFLGDRYGFCLRSGAADGADKAFESGAPARQIFLPWAKFSNHPSHYITQPPEAFEISAKFHPGWGKLREPVRKLMARNAMQVLGPDLKTPSEMVCCYTYEGRGSGGTGQAIRIATAYGIPVFDFGLFDYAYKRLITYLEETHS